MATAGELQDSLTSFAESCNENAKLMAMIKDWNRVMHIRATDLNTDAGLVTQGGTVTALRMPRRRRTSCWKPTARF